MKSMVPPSPAQAVHDKRVLGVRRSIWAKLGLVVLFALIGRLQLDAVLTQLAALQDSANSERLLALSSAGAGLLFTGLIMATTCFRLPPINQATGLRPRLAAVAGGFMSMVLAVLPPAGLPAGLQLTAVGMVVVGTVLSFAVLCWLGRSFSVMAEARRLVVGGPYRLVRHPLYVCEELAVVGVLILHFSPLALALIAVQWSAQLRRMRHEEAVLAESFPDYASYAVVTPRLIPSRSSLRLALGMQDGRTVAPVA